MRSSESRAGSDYPGESLRLFRCEVSFAAFRFFAENPAIKLLRSIEKLLILYIYIYIYNYLRKQHNKISKNEIKNSQTTISQRLARQSSVCANENEPQTVSGPVVVRLTTTRFTGTVSIENRSSLAAYPRIQYVPPWDSVPHPENCTFSELPTSSLRAGPQAPTNTTFGR
jgi:hypothetical protein